jgi:Flp pilus assembly pilin Flp
VVPIPNPMKTFIDNHARSWALLLSRLTSERGQTMAEYGILIGVIAIVVVVAAITLGGNVSDLFRSSATHL